jgi:hypothetical protein
MMLATLSAIARWKGVCGVMAASRTRVEQGRVGGVQKENYVNYVCTQRVTYVTRCVNLAAQRHICNTQNPGTMNSQDTSGARACLIALANPSLSDAPAQSAAHHFVKR